MLSKVVPTSFLYKGVVVSSREDASIAKRLVCNRKRVKCTRNGFCIAFLF